MSEVLVLTIPLRRSFYLARVMNEREHVILQATIRLVAIQRTPFAIPLRSEREVKTPAIDTLTDEHLDRTIVQSGKT